MDAVYRNLVEQARQKQNNGQTHVITPVIDNSDDASQLDSGIRSLQGNDEGDNTQNTAEMSSPVGNMPSNMGLTKNGGSNFAAVLATNSFSNGTGGFSGGVSRFLESRSKTFGPTFLPLKNTRFEIAKTQPQVNLALKFGENVAKAKEAGGDGSSIAEKKAAFTLSGTGAMFLKSRRQIESNLQQASNMACSNGGNIIIEGVVGTPPGVKGILRDSSLTDMRRRAEKENDAAECPGAAAAAVEDKKSVRFNLEHNRQQASPEEDKSSSRRMTQSPDASVNSDADDDDNAWDLDYDEGDCVGIGHLVSDSQSSNNPFLSADEKPLKDIKVITVPKAQTIQMLKAQSFSMDLPEKERAKLTELSRSQSVEAHNVSNAVGYLNKLQPDGMVKPLYDDTDSDSKGSSVRSFIINKSEDNLSSSRGEPPSNNPFDLEELGRRHSKEVEQLERKLQSSQQQQQLADGKFQKTSGLKTLKVASKLVGFLKKDADRAIDSASVITIVDKSCKTEQEKKQLLKQERELLEDQLQQEIDEIKKEHEYKLKNIRHEYDLRLTSHQHQMDEALELQLEHYRANLEQELEQKRKAVVDEHKAQMATLQKNHNELLQELERDLKSEEELIKKEHQSKLSEMRDKLTHELELEKQKMRDSGEDRLYEKVRCEKRLLEDKYRCLKEKYVRLKTDVKLSLERRNRRREAQAMQQSLQTNTTTGSETERSISNKPSIGNSENRSLTLSTSYRETTAAGIKGIKPPLPPKTHLTAAAGAKEKDKSAERSGHQMQASSQRKPGITAKYLKHLQVQDDNTSISQSDNTLSNNYNKGRYLPAPILSDNGNSDSEAYVEGNQENNNNKGNAQRKKLFSRMKSASTSRLNSDYKCDRPCTPVENLRHQLQKLEDLEDQFPDNTLDTTYHLRYPFSDISNEHAGASSELEFFKHRIHLERDSVRRAKESLRTQRTNFRARQREIKTRHKATVTRHTLDQLIQEEKELTEMEVNLHRTRALLGEKVIRLRHLEQSLLRIYEKEKPVLDLLGVEPKDDATLSDLSSHSSSGFSSTDFASGAADTQNMLNKRKDLYHQESSECIQNLEILNAEIREILDILGKGQNQHQAGNLED